MNNIKKCLLLMLFWYSSTHVTGIVTQTLSTAAANRDVIGLHVAANSNGQAMAVWGLNDSGVYSIQASFFDGTSWSAATTISDGDGGLSPWVGISNGKAVVVWQTSLSQGRIKSRTFRIYDQSWYGVVIVKSNPQAIFEYPNSTGTDYPTNRVRVFVDENGNAFVSWAEVNTSANPTQFTVRHMRALDGKTGNAVNWHSEFSNRFTSTNRVFMDPTADIMQLFPTNSSYSGTAQPIVSWVVENTGGYIARYTLSNTVQLNQYATTIGSGTGTSNSLNINQSGDAFSLLVMNNNHIARDFRKVDNSVITECINNPTVNTVYHFRVALSDATNPTFHQVVSLLQTSNSYPFNQQGYRIALFSTPSLDCINPLPSDILDIDYSATYARLNPILRSFGDNTALLMWNSQGASGGKIGILQYDGSEWDTNNITYIDANLKSATTPSLDMPFYMTTITPDYKAGHYTFVVWWDDVSGVIKSLVSNSDRSPFAPTIAYLLTASCDSNNNTINLQWRRSYDTDLADQYVYRDNGDGVFTNISGSLGTGSSVYTTYTDTTISLGVNYTYFIRSENTSGFTSDSNGIAITCQADKPLPPVNLNAQCEVVDNDTFIIYLTWSLDPANTTPITKLQLYRETAGNTPELIDDNIDPQQLVYKDFTAETSTIYTYRLYSVNSVDNSTTISDPSTEAHVGPCFINAPPAPDAFNAQCTGPTSIELSWETVPTSFAVDNYVIYRDGQQIATVDSTIDTYTDSPVTTGQEYVYEIKSVRSSTNPQQISDASRTTATCLPGQPNAPTAITASCAPDAVKAINVTWHASDTPGISIYRIYRFGLPEPIAEVNVDAEDAEYIYQDTEIEYDLTYYYGVSAVTSIGSVESNIVQSEKITCFATAPNAISDFSADCNTGFIALSWTAPNCTKQEVFRDGNLVATFDNATADGTVMQHDDYFAIQLDTPYIYKVRAYNENEYTDSNRFAVVCYNTMPDSPDDEDLVCTIEGNRPAVRISWNPSPTVGIVSQNIYRNNRLIRTVGPTISEIIDSSIAFGVTYSYNISAVTAGGEETKSPTLSASCNNSPIKAQNITGFCTFNRFALEGEFFKTINWTIPSNRTDDVASQTILRNDELIATLDANQRQFIDHDRPTENESYKIVVKNTGDVETRNPTTLTLGCG